MGIAIPQVVTEDRASSAFVVDGSLKFNGTDQYLRKTFGTAGHQSIFTWSCWVKRNHLDTWQRIFTCEPGSNLIGGLSFKDSDSKIRLQQQGFGQNNHLLTSAYYRDTAAWYHIVMRVDTFHATLPIDLGYTLMENDKIILGILAAILDMGLHYITIPLPIIMK